MIVGKKFSFLCLFFLGGGGVGEDGRSCKKLVMRERKTVKLGILN